MVWVVEYEAFEVHILSSGVVAVCSSADKAQAVIAAKFPGATVSDSGDFYWERSGCDYRIWVSQQEVL